MASESSWTLVGKRVRYDGRVRLVDHSVVLQDGSPANYEVDESIPFAVATLVIDHDALLLTRQYRYPIGRWIFDLPGGAGDAGETPADAARRELEEELGLIPSDLSPLHTFYFNPGRAAWPVHIFSCTVTLADGHVDRSDPAEQVHFVRMPLVELDALITHGEIVDPSLIIARAAAAARGTLPPLHSVTAT